MKWKVENLEHQVLKNEFKRIGLTTFEGLETYRQTFNFTPRRSKEEITSANIIGVLEGKSKKDEYVIISAHYDHLGNEGKVFRRNLLPFFIYVSLVGVLGLLAYFLNF